MEMKFCNRCGIERELCIKNFFFREKEQRWQTPCKICKAEYDRKYREENKDHLSNIKKIYQEKNKENIAEYHLNYYEENFEQISLYNKEYYIENREEIIDQVRKYSKNNLEKINEKQKIRRKSDPLFKLKQDMTGAFSRFLSSNNLSKNKKSTFSFLPYTKEELLNHLTNLFSHPDNLIPNDYPDENMRGKVWMTWENRGIINRNVFNLNDYTTWKWQIDHIRPMEDYKISSIDDKETICNCFALSNLRPLRADINARDGANRTRHTKPRKPRKLKTS